MPSIKKLVKQKYKRDYSKDLNNERRATQASFYNSPGWPSLRISKLSKDPMCERCKSLNIITLACEVHHIIKFMTGATIQEEAALFYDWENLQSTCKPCHKIMDGKIRIY